MTRSPGPVPERLLTLPFAALFAAALAFFTAGGIVLPVATRFADGPLGADVESYGALATELASLGYVVIGPDHPSQAAAVLVSDTVAVYSGDPPLDRAEATTQLHRR